MRAKRHSSKSARVLSTGAVRAALVLSLVLAATVGPTGCGSGEPTGTTNSADSMQLAMSDISRLTPAAPQTEVASAAASMTWFGLDLYKILAQDAGSGNLVFSPSSIVTALAMTYAGANGVTAQEMASTLHFTLEGDALHAAFNSLDSALESRSFSERDPEGRDVGVLIKTANSLWGQKDTVFERLFLDTLAENYGAGIRLVDYKKAAEEARQAINEWVADQTEDKIQDLIPEGTLDALTRLVLVNAIYLDATWETQFDPEATKDGDFTTLDGQTVTTPMMRQSTYYPYGAGDGWQAVQLPYVGGKVAMLLIVPDAGEFADVEAQLTAGDGQDGLIEQAEASLSEGREISLLLPRFEFRTQAGLADALRALGMKAAFDPDNADFSGMTTQEPLYISDVIHEAFIAVDEEGTEAAAATAVVMRAAGIAAPPLELLIDRPFIFALRDLNTGALLFFGRVTDPTA